MVAAMAGFALEDVLFKLATAVLPIWQVLATTGLAGGLIFGAAAVLSGSPVLSRSLLRPAVLLRNLGEAVGSATYLSALALSTLSGVSAILQATPLAVTLGAALFLRESVGWRRWSAIVLGFLGVLLVVKPGTASFTPASLLAVVAVLMLAMRDLCSRAVPAEVSSLQLTAWGFLSVVPAGLMTLAVTGAAPVMPAAADIGRLCALLLFGGVGYYALVAATRTGEVAAVVPFRYTRLVFAVALGFFIFAERPDAPMLLGAALIVGTGLFTIWRSAVRRRMG